MPVWAWIVTIGVIVIAGGYDLWSFFRPVDIDRRVVYVEVRPGEWVYMYLRDYERSQIDKAD